MTTTEINIACAELDGWVIPAGYTNYRTKDGKTVFFNPTHQDDPVPSYFESYDAIIPLIQKQNEGVLAELESNIEDKCYFWCTSTPLELCTALLKATGKWKE